MKVVLGRAVLSGKVDRIEGTPDGSGLRVVDYKTGSSKPRGRGARPPPAARRLPAGRRAAAPSASSATARPGRPCSRSARPPLVKTTLQTSSRRCADAETRSGPPSSSTSTAEGMAGATFQATVGDWCKTLPGAVVAARPSPRGGCSDGARPAVRHARSPQPSASRQPTAQQVAVIEAPMSPLLVVAGAGSGKTETMTGRVVWLVANGFVEPDQVLGLTFTRKAATELSERIGARLRLLQQRDVWHPAHRRRRDRRRGPRRHADRVDLPLVCRSAGARARAAAGLRVRVPAAVRGGRVAVRLRGGRRPTTDRWTRSSSPSRR